MSYQVLARKWRPQTFDAVVGQQHVLTALANGLSLGRIHHAYLLSGTRGVGKTSIARLLAKGLNCEQAITSTPCGQCTHCQEIEQGRFVDLIEIDAASRTKVEDTRELLDNVQYVPARGRFKVYLIDEVHMLSRHSFNALLKTLEEPPAHVKFVLATTDAQKLPVTVLSRCLQFHLKALNVQQICTQLEKILQAEGIISDPHALQLLAKAANGSMRDALSLTDQAIAIGQGKVTTAPVNQMLGTLDGAQPLAIIEALVSADGVQLMAQVEQVASRGVDWENLLIEALTLLHRIAMMQLLPTPFDSPLNDQDTLTEQRLHELAKILPPTDIQLYYQTLLIGRKELSYAPDRRMGVEMTLLRALAFHPQTPISEPQVRPLNTPQKNITVTPPLVSSTINDIDSTNNETRSTPSTITVQLLQAQTQLFQQKKDLSTKKKPSAEKSLPVEKNRTDTKKAYHWQAKTQPIAVKAVTILQTLRNALQNKENPELMEKLTQEAIIRDPWAKELDKLTMPKMVQQLALNTFKQQIAPENICLHLRSAQRHLNSLSTQKTLADALSALYGKQVELEVVEDDNTAQLTPSEWRQAIYAEKLAQARQSIVADNNIQTLRRFFDADLDEESITPI
ncbi:DNA polymerase III subunit gamma/tau [Candidatus Fukatsuia symbiotica]|uniref:DNA polymerase III subunit gamma/tau n=1 Tax=Candidatus Fukatsuia symbiotica TaxID=1878942 RepID=A0A2U8I678_9GAMM|nr:DNA polymerase III subunit gamma/tau [Candidatus Fukatsuia symbiotica]AWK13364.1 DNA polymerase III subunit gamma/tau [Candidatus Fukatsuia symbiotica]MEA9444252.1 DNA polymerase III subunit gamma/tau [Candidatus Fukatsuia symbiotica]